MHAMNYHFVNNLKWQALRHNLQRWVHEHKTRSLAYCQSERTLAQPDQQMGYSSQPHVGYGASSLFVTIPI